MFNVINNVIIFILIIQKNLLFKIIQILLYLFYNFFKYIVPYYFLYNLFNIFCSFIIIFIYHKFNYINYHIKLFFHLIQNLYILQNTNNQLNFHQNIYTLFNTIDY